MADESKVSVALKRTYGYQGEYYGPGESVSVPIGLATALGLTPGSAPKPVSAFADGSDAAARAAADAANGDERDDGTDADESDELPSLADMPAHLESISDIDELKALKRQDKRKGGKELIQARIDALKAAE